MATLKDPLSTLKIQQNKVDKILKDNQTAGRGSDAKSWLQNWRYERGIPKDSGVMPSVDEVPLYYRPFLFPRADASSTDTKTAAFTQKQMDGLNKVFPGAEGRINDFRKKQFNMGPMKIKPGVQLPDLAQFPDEAGGYVTTGGFFVDPNGDAYINTPEGMINDGEYNPDIHGMMVPLAKNKTKNGMKIAGKKNDEINRQLILNSGGANPEDYLTPKQLQRYNEDPSKFIDIDIDLVKNAKNGMKIATNPDFEIEKQILDARTNKKAQEDAGQDMLLDRIFNKKK